ncbi:hypothetical protein PVE_R2G0633 [Pseudomonas veronii 1YdBTEX2]|uniref:Uncharacterized protein n=1 Tax=Pseudomonas veronii 1YdBTEX2 TaxID=1295141 RepID=A0A1D3K8G8_PSEVE|nr:hypothetical protein PVE_R2G0633 [Pseudomonas veronii 1YdBTEX2]
MKKLMVVALIAIAIAGCGDSSQPTSTKWIGGSVVDQPEFRLPGSTYGLKSTQDSKAQSGVSDPSPTHSKPPIEA